MGSKVYLRDQASTDGLIYSATNIADAATRYIYFDLLREGYKFASIQHIITANTLTLEASNGNFEKGAFITGTATATNGAGTTLTCSTLNSVHGFTTDTELIGIQVRILEDNTTPSNIGLTRIVTAYTGATGVLTLESAFGAVTSGVTKFRLEDNPSSWGRRVSDPVNAQWTDVTNLLFGVASTTTSGIWSIDTDQAIERFRIKALTTNAVNALNIRLSRSR